MKFQLKELVEEIKCGWGVYTCEVEMDDGSFRTGSVQADSIDGHMIAPETLELDE